MYVPRRQQVLFLFIFNSFINVWALSAAKPMPIVMWHGMGDACCMPYSLGPFKDFMEAQIPGVYVKSIKIGDSIVEDLENGYFMTPSKQVEMVCEELVQDSNLRDGFNAIGFSQGSQFLRAVQQRCGHRIPPMRNLITLGGQHQGVYGLPNCAALKHEYCDYMRRVLTYAAYFSWVQHSLVQATYWHDPLKEEEYQHNSIFLADINNEVAVNQSYARHLNKLQHFVMVKFEDDTVVQPKETEWFGYYDPGQTDKMLNLRESRIYLEDRLGLRAMDRAGKLVFLSSPGNHLHFSDQWFIQNIIKPYLL